MPKPTSAKEKIPSGQIIWEERCNEKGEPFAYVTSDALRQKYIYWAVEGNKLTKKRTETSPSCFPWRLEEVIL